MNILEWWTSVLAGDERRFVMKIIKNYPESVKPPKGLGRVISKHLEIKTRFLIVEQRARMALVSDNFSYVNSRPIRLYSVNSRNNSKIKGYSTKKVGWPFLF